MPQWHSDLTKKKITGGKRRRYRTNRAFEKGNYATETRLGDAERKIEKSHGNVFKIKLMYEKYANVTNPSTGKTEKVEILRVIKNPANVDYERRRIMTKGAIIGTLLGEAVITSRLGQNGVVNALLISGKSK